MLFYYFTMSTLLSGVAAFFQWRTPSNINMWLLLGAIGVFGTLYQVFSTLSYAKAPVRLMAPLTFLNVVFGGVFDWLIWGNEPTMTTMVGALLVLIGAGVTIYFGQRELSRSQK